MTGVRKDPRIMSKRNDPMQFNLPFDAKPLRGIPSLAEYDEPQTPAAPTPSNRAFVVDADGKHWRELGSDAPPVPMPGEEPVEARTLAEVYGFLGALREARALRPDLPRSAFVAAGRIRRAQFDPERQYLSAAVLIEWAEYAAAGGR
jgi:hypothetical protein